MAKIELYEKAYKILNELTPLQADCGELCNRACCNSEEEDAGMYLFPGEEVMYSPIPAWLHIKESSFMYGGGKPALIAICSGQCERRLRPLSCRIFPLTPYIKYNGMMYIQMDSRAVPVCPLTKTYTKESLDQDFITAVENIFKFLIRDKEIKAFIFELSRLIDEQERLFHYFNAEEREKKHRRAVRRR